MLQMSKRIKLSMLTGLIGFLGGGLIGYAFLRQGGPAMQVGAIFALMGFAAGTVIADD